MSELARPLEVTLYNPLILPGKLGPGEARGLAYGLLTPFLLLLSSHSTFFDSFLHLFTEGCLDYASLCQAPNSGRRGQVNETLILGPLPFPQGLPHGI